MRRRPAPAPRVASLLALLLALGACGKGPFSSAAPPPHRTTASSSAPTFFHPDAGSLHVRPAGQPDGLPTVRPDLQRGNLTVVTPGTGELHVQLLAAPVPGHLRLTEGGPGVQVVWEETTRGRSLSGDRATHHVAWAFHATPASDLVAHVFDGLAGDEVRDALAAAVPDWRSEGLAAWWWSVDDQAREIRAWSHAAWWSPRAEKPNSRSGSSGDVATDDLTPFQRRPAQEPLVLGTWTWFWPGAGTDLGTQGFVDARERLRFEELLPDARVKLGGKVYAPQASPYLTWCLVARWIPDAGGPAAPPEPERPGR